MTPVDHESTRLIELLLGKRITIQHFVVKKVDSKIARKLIALDVFGAQVDIPTPE
jgi:hypothetical protein